MSCCPDQCRAANGELSLTRRRCRARGKGAAGRERGEKLGHVAHALDDVERDPLRLDQIAPFAQEYLDQLAPHVLEHIKLTAGIFDHNAPRPYTRIDVGSREEAANSNRSREDLFALI